MNQNMMAKNETIETLKLIQPHFYPDGGNGRAITAAIYYLERITVFEVKEGGDLAREAALHE